MAWVDAVLSQIFMWVWFGLHVGVVIGEYDGRATAWPSSGCSLVKLGCKGAWTVMGVASTSIWVLLMEMIFGLPKSK